MVPAIIVTEKRQAHRQALRLSVALLVVVCAALPAASTQFATLVVALTGFFIAFNILEALQPSMVSRVAPPEFKGLALGLYNTAQSAGLFVGGAFGGWLVARGGTNQVFVAVAILAGIWLLVTWGMKPLALRARTDAR